MLNDALLVGSPSGLPGCWFIVMRLYRRWKGRRILIGLCRRRKCLWVERSVGVEWQEERKMGRENLREWEREGVKKYGRG